MNRKYLPVWTFCRHIQVPVAMALLLMNAGLFAMPAIIPAPPELAASAYLLLDAKSGEVLVRHNDSQRLPPASLTKMMTSLVAAMQLEEGLIKLTDEVDISVKAWSKGGSKMYIREGTKVTLSDLLRGIIIQSGNDASIAIAEHIAADEDAFADLMNQTAKSLGMDNSHFVNATGWPDENHYSSAYDLALLADALIERYPEHYKLYSEKFFTYNNIRQPNRNNLLWRDKSVDGVKTGHTEAAGYCLVASAEREGMRLISVVMGTRSEEARIKETQKLFSYGYRYFQTVRLYDKNESLSRFRVWKGTIEDLDLGISEEVILTLPRGSSQNLKATTAVDGVIEAPITKGQKLGSIKVTNLDEVVYEGPLVALTGVEAAGFFKVMWDSIILFFYGLFGFDVMDVS